MVTIDNVLAIAISTIGETEKPNNLTRFGRWYGLDGQPWCAMWVSWVFYGAGYALTASTSKGFAYTPSGAAWFAQQGRWHTTGPKRGDVVFFDWPGDGVDRISHVAIVESVNADGSVNTIEGNTQPGDEGNQSDGGAVRRRRRSVGIVGYGRPPYDLGYQEPEKPQQPRTEDEEMDFIAVPTDFNGNTHDANKNAVGPAVLMSPGSWTELFEGNDGHLMAKGTTQQPGPSLRRIFCDPDALNLLKHTRTHKPRAS